MADFSALCPLFNTGVYNELAVVRSFSAASRATTTKWGIPVFGRTVVVTAAYVAKLTTQLATATALKVALCRAASWAATRTVFATLNLSSTITTQVIRKPLAMTMATAKTFSATQVLTLKFLTNEAGGKGIDVWIRYKEK